MVFADEEKALHLFEKIGYYRLSGYWYPLLADKEKHTFKPNADFETAFCLYKFDCELRKLISAEIEKIEVAIRAKMAYELSMAYNMFWIEDVSLFTSSHNHLATLDKINEEYIRSNEEFVIAFKNKYSDPLPPACIILEVTSFGTLSPRKPQQTWLKDNTICNNRVYYILSMIIYLLNVINPKHTFKQKLEELFAKYPNVDVAAVGFPTTWRSEPLWIK